MRVVPEAVRSAERTLSGGFRRVPGVRQLFSGPPAGEYLTTGQRALSDNVGKVAIVGDFGYSKDPELRRQTADRVVGILLENGVIELSSSVDIRTMVPDIAQGDNDRMLDESALSLAHALDAMGDASQYLHYDPVAIAGHGVGNLPTVANARIGAIAPGREGEAFGDRLVVVANPVFLSHAFPNLLDHNMNAGGVAMLAEVGENPRDNRYVQLWPTGVSLVEETI